ncbi:MAG: histidinol dehydrogenase [Porticoccaceae bacterium]|nr:histidinol dehydrogenase [Porticoccaceae bacterium]
MSRPLINRLSTSDGDFLPTLDKLTAWNAVSDSDIEAKVAEIIQQVRCRGDQALLEYSNQFDRRSCQRMDQLCLGREQLAAALESIDSQTRSALESAAQRINDYHQHQLQQSWQYQEANGTQLGQQITALERVGLYVPGGKASYPSSVLMNCIPARIAQVDEIIMTVPAPDDKLSPIVLAAAAIAGVDKVFTLGGAQAIAAMAYGTESIPKVDKIVGPGNSFVATAKRMVFGSVGLDMVAGPSEILIICDGKTDPDWIAMDLFSQAEHDENAQSILISWDRAHLDAVYQSIAKLLPEMERQDIIAQSLANRGALIEVADKDEAIMLSNRIAPEHLELSVEDPQSWLPEIRHAGAIFLGRFTAEALGDYCAGPNHVLPTSATARFSSPLGVYDFQKRSSVIYCSESGASELGEVASILGRGESLTAHARSAEYRIKRVPDKKSTG